MQAGGQQVAGCYQSPTICQPKRVDASVSCGTANRCRHHDHHRPPPLPHSHNLNASNAMQIMSFRFSIKMLNHYFTLLGSDPIQSDPIRKQGWSWEGLRDRPDRRSNTHTHLSLRLWFIVCGFAISIYLLFLLALLGRTPLVQSTTGKKITWFNTWLNYPVATIGHRIRRQTANWHNSNTERTSSVCRAIDMCAVGWTAITSFIDGKMCRLFTQPTITKELG